MGFSERILAQCLPQDHQECTVVDANGTALLSFALVYGFRNIQNLVQKIKRKKCSYHYAEVMACPSGVHPYPDPDLPLLGYQIKCTEVPHL
jgi:hypothetical protein